MHKMFDTISINKPYQNVCQFPVHLFNSACVRQAIWGYKKSEETSNKSIQKPAHNSKFV